jgi:hypothetical protein
VIKQLNSVTMHFKKFCHTKTVGDGKSNKIFEFSVEKYINTI